jgi:hypothetical protein
MRKPGAGRLAALLCLGLALAPASAQTYKPAPTMQGNWFRDMFSSPPPAEVKDVELERPTTKSDRAVVLQRLQKALDRRRDVCLRLRQIAADTDDTALAEEADRLDAMAFQIYQAKANRLLGVGSSTEPVKRESEKPARKRADDPVNQESGSARQSGQAPSREGER